MPQAHNTREVGARVERLLADLATTADPAVAAKAEELARSLVELYGAGVQRMVEIVAAQPQGEDVLAAFTADDFVASLLILHDLHPIAVEDRVQVALDGVRPYLGSHAGGVDFLGIDAAGVAQLSLQGSCDGCPSSLVTVKLAIERAIMDAAPELAGIEVAGVVEEKPAGAVLHQIQPYRPAEDPTEAEPGWFPLPDLSGLPPGEVRAVAVVHVPLAVCRVDGRLYAYRDACPECGSALAGGSLDGPALICPGCAGRYDVQLAGRGVGVDGDVPHLDPIPLVGEDRRATVALPVGAHP